MAPSRPLRPALAALLAAAWAASAAFPGGSHAEPARVVFAGSLAGDTLRLDFSADTAGSSYEYEGDYRQRKRHFRIRAVETYRAAMGDFAGRATESYYWRFADGDGSPGDGIFETGFTAVLSQTLRRGDGTESAADIEYLSGDPLRQDFPLKEDPASLGRPTGSGYLVQVHGEGLRLSPPEWASGLEVYTLSGTRVHRVPLLTGGAVELPAGLGRGGLLFVRWLGEGAVSETVLSNRTEE